MLTKQEILDHINLYYSDCLINIHIFKKSIIDEIFDISMGMESDNMNDNQRTSEKFFIKSIVEEYIEEIRLFVERREKFQQLLNADRSLRNLHMVDHPISFYLLSIH